VPSWRAWHTGCAKAFRPFAPNFSGSLDLPNFRRHSRQNDLAQMSDSVPSDTPTPLENPEQVEREGLEITERDIVFECPHCHGELVVDLEGAGLSLACVHCGQTVTVPEYHGPSLHFLEAATSKLTDALRNARKGSPRKFDFGNRTREDLIARRTELERQTEEIQAQSVELRGQVNHALIQLHRYQLKLEMLNESQAELETELKAIAQQLSPEAPQVRSEK
jgi:transcription elongation factor Elf1